MDTPLFFKAHSFLIDRFVNNPDFETMFTDFAEPVMGYYKQDPKFIFFELYPDFQYAFVILLRLGFPFLAERERQHQDLRFVLKSGQHERWITTPNEAPPSTWSIGITEEYSSIEVYKKFVHCKMVNAISVFDRLMDSVKMIEEVQEKASVHSKIIDINEVRSGTSA